MVMYVFTFDARSGPGPATDGNFTPSLERSFAILSASLESTPSELFVARAGDEANLDDQTIAHHMQTRCKDDG